MRITVASMPLSRKGPLDSVLLVMSEGAEKGFPILRQTYIILKTGQLLFSFGFPVEKKTKQKTSLRCWRHRGADSAALP